MRDVELLLSKTESIVEKHEMISCETGGNFNIFEIANIITSEIIICRVLSELFSPTGCHGQKSAYLEIFMRDCLGLYLDKDEIEKARVYRECETDTGRRIDIAIEAGGCFLPIEVKIYAQDQPRQCCDYYQFAQNKCGKATKVIYLTLDGHAPSEDSATGLTREGDGYREVIQISFAYDILSWLEKCLALRDIIRTAPVREILIQFISAIKKITNQLEDKSKMEMVQLLSKSSQNMRSAKAIADVLNDCRTKKINEFFRAVEEELENDNRLQRMSANELHPNYDYTFEKCVDSLKVPGINYIVKHVAELDVDITFRIEIEDNLFTGFGLAQNQKRFENIDLVNNEKIRELFRGIDGKNRSSWWIFWQLIHFENNPINFKNFNENYFKLFDSDKFNEIVKTTVEQVRSMLGKLK